MRIFDVFPIFNEIEIVKSRLSEFSKIENVTHVGVQASLTYSGKPKPIYFKSEDFNVSNFKIFTVDRNPNWGPWEAEDFQRNASLEIIERRFQPDDDDLFICTDADEILRNSILEEVIERTKETKTASLAFRYHFVSRQWVEQKPWIAGTVFRWKNRPTNLSVIRHSTDNVINNAGWHMSWWGNADGFHYKLNSFSHTELNTEEVHNKVEAMINEGFGFVNNKLSVYDGDPDDFPKDLPLVPTLTLEEYREERTPHGT
jgi:beta-1,4-mannosyl-glycoprotein beta-1,4-N-acetylglucosaminyltransferase